MAKVTRFLIYLLNVYIFPDFEYKSLQFVNEIKVLYPLVFYLGQVCLS